MAISDTLKVIVVIQLFATYVYLLSIHKNSQLLGSWETFLVILAPRLA